MNTDLNNIKLEDTKLYTSYYSFWEAFKDNNITTVGQVLEDNLIDNITIHMQDNTVRELNGFIALLKCKYLGIPLENTFELNKVGIKNNISKNWKKHYKYQEEGYEYFYPVNFQSLGISYNLAKKIERLIIVPKGKEILNIPFYKILEESLNRNILKGSIKEIISVIMYSYHISNEFVLSNIDYNDELSFLQKQHEYLISLKNSLNFQIEIVEEKIKKLQEKRSAQM